MKPLIRGCKGESNKKIIHGNKSYFKMKLSGKFKWVVFLNFIAIFFYGFNEWLKSSSQMINCASQMIKVLIIFF